MEKKQCRQCGIIFDRQKGETPARYVSRIYCSLDCRQDSQKKPAEQKAVINCKICGDLLVQKPGEKYIRWMRRQTCSTPCARTLRAQTRRITMMGEERAAQLLTEEEKRLAKNEYMKNWRIKHGKVAAKPARPRPKPQRRVQVGTEEVLTGLPPGWYAGIPAESRAEVWTPGSWKVESGDGSDV